MARDVTIKINATDAASPIFKKVGTEAKTMGTQVTTSAEQSARSLETMQKRTMAVGLAVGTLIGGMSMAGTAFVNQETQIRGLTRAYGDSTDTILKFSDELQKNTVYSNDAARQSAIYASSLIQNYGLTADQIAIVIQRSADLAAVNVTAQGTQIELTDAVSRTSAALRGEAEAGELLGLSMSDTFLKAEALKRGIQGWGTSMTEAEKAQFRLIIMLEQSQYAMGAAAEMADTSAGKAKQLKNQVQDLTQEFGGALGPMGEYLSVMGSIALAAPLAGAAIGKLGLGLAALGVRPGMLGPAALIGGGAALAYGYSQDTLGTTQINTLANQFFMAMAGAINALTPGSIMDTQKYVDQMATNAQWDTINSLFQAPGVSQDAVVQRVAELLGVSGTIIPGESGDSRQRGRPDEYVPPTAEQVLEAAAMGAASMGIPLSAYLLNEIKKNANLTIDPLSGSFVTWQEMSAYQFARGGRRDAYGGWQPGMYPAAAVPLADQLGVSRYYGDISTAGYTGPYQPAQRDPYTGTGYGTSSNVRGMGATSGRDDLGYGGQQLAPLSIPETQVQTAGFFRDADLDIISAAKIQAALRETLGEYYHLADGINSAKEASSTFKQIQDGLIAGQEVWTGQISEFSGQQNALTAGYEVLQKRQEAGVELSAEEQALLNNYPALYERITGAVDDATVENALLAASYVENMQKSDEWKSSLDDTNSSIGTLIGVIEEFILSLTGVPDEVRTRILLERDDAMQKLMEYTGALFSIPGTISTALNIYPNLGSDVLRFFGGGSNGMTMSAYADGGTHYGGGGWAIVGERGPEGVWLPNGAQVMNTEGSQSRFGAGGDTFKINTVNIYDPNPRQIGQAIREAAVGSSR